MTDFDLFFRQDRVVLALSRPRHTPSRSKASAAVEEGCLRVPVQYFTAHPDGDETSLERVSPTSTSNLHSVLVVRILVPWRGSAAAALASASVRRPLPSLSGGTPQRQDSETSKRLYQRPSTNFPPSPPPPSRFIEIRMICQYARRRSASLISFRRIFDRHHSLRPWLEECLSLVAGGAAPRSFHEPPLRYLLGHDPSARASGS